MRLVFDVTPLSHPLTGIGNYMLGMLGGIAEASEGRHELVVLRTDRAAERTTSAGGARWDSRRAQDRARPAAVEPLAKGSGADCSACRSSGSSARWTSSTSRTGCIRRSGAACGRRRSTTSARSTIPSGSIRGHGALHVPKALHAAKTCDLIFANSRYTADDVVRTLGVPEERVVVAYPGIHARYWPDGPRAERPAPYLLTTATSEPRKNLRRCSDAFALVRARRPELELLVAGEENRDAARRCPVPRLRRTPKTCRALYRGAEAFVFPSLFEGFGIPVVEAMASGTPTVVSTHTSLDEASGDAAIRVEPKSPEAIASGIETALTEGRALVPRGLEHARKFTWRACGEAMLRGYESARD